jgi:hypothetical protein
MEMGEGLQKSPPLRPKLHLGLNYKVTLSEDAQSL